LNALIDNSEEITGKPSDIGGVFYFSILLPWIDGDKHKDKDSIEKELLKEYKMEGYFLEDKELIKKLDKKIEEERESTVAKIKINKNGSISKSSQTLTREAYKGLLKYVNDKVLEIGKEIISGKILIEPFKRNQNIPCKWCSYIDICQFDKTMPDNKYKIIKKVDKKDFENILEKIGEEHDKLD
jgi:ATP-dependent helicase/nuclease subunit B